MLPCWTELREDPFPKKGQRDLVKSGSLDWACQRSFIETKFLSLAGTDISESFELRSLGLSNNTTMEGQI